MGFNFRKYFTGLNLVPKTGSDTTTSAGDIQVLSNDNKARYHNGTSPSPLVTESHLATLTNKSVGDAVAFTEIATPSLPTAGNLKFYAKSDNSFYSLNSSGVETQIGSGGGGGSDLLKVQATWLASDLQSGNPLQIIAAPGAGNAFVIESVLVEMTYNSAPWTDTTSDIQFADGAGGGNPVGLVDISGTPFQVSADATVFELATANNLLSNSPIYANLSNTPWSGGDSDLLITIYYRIIAQGGSLTRISSSGVSNAANDGTGQNVFRNLVSSTLHFNSLAAGTNMTITDNGIGTLTFDATGGGGSGDVVGGSSSLAGEMVVYNGTTGKIIKRAAGSDANNNFILDFTNTGEEVHLKGNGNHAITMLISATSSGSSARSISSYGTDEGDNVFSVGSHSSTHSNPSTAVWSSHHTNGSLFQVDNVASTATHKFANVNGTLVEMKADNSFNVYNPAGSGTFSVNAGAPGWFNFARSVNGQITANIQNINSGTSAFTELDISGNSGQLLIGHSSTTSSGGGILTDSAYIYSNNTNGLFLRTLGGKLRMQAATQINMTLPIFANDAAAGAGGLTTGDVFINSGNSNAITSKS